MRRSVFPFIVTLFFACGLWVAVNLAGDVRTTVHIPLRVDAPEQLAVASSLPRTVVATVQGPAWRIAQFVWLSSPRCRIDLGEVTRAPHVASVSHKSLVQSMALPSSVTLIDVEPDSIAVELDTRAQKTVPVVPIVFVDCKKGFEQPVPATVDPDSVTIMGAQSVIESVTSWSTRPATLRNVTGKVRITVPLADSLGDRVVCSQPKVALTIDVQEIAERLFIGIPIHINNVPASSRVHVDPPQINVMIRGGAEMLAQMAGTEIHASVDYMNVLDAHAEQLPVRISAPAHTSVVRLSPHTVSWMVSSDQ